MRLAGCGLAIGENDGVDAVEGGGDERTCNGLIDGFICGVGGEYVIEGE